MSNRSRYTQVVTAGGLSETLKGLEVSIELAFKNAEGAPCPVVVPDAWRFDLAGCQPGGATASFVRAPGGCPVLGGGHRQSIVACTGTSVAIVHVATSFDAATPNPDSTYTLATIVYDQSQSVVGPSHDGLCGGVEQAGCAQFAGGSYVRPDDSVGYLSPGSAVM